jgi:hypothetical protein
MCNISLDKALNITIHNQYSDLELISPVYFSDGTTYCVSPDQKAGTGNIMETSFGIDSKQKDLKCVLLYKLQRKRAAKTDNQSDNNAVFIENTVTNMYLLVAWVAKNYKHKFCAYLMEFTDDFTWDEDKLWALYREYNDQFHMDYRPRIITWSMHNNAVMKMRFDITYGSDYKLDIVISEGNREGNMREPISVDPKGLVLSLPMLVVLIYMLLDLLFDHHSN